MQLLHKKTERQSHLSTASEVALRIRERNPLLNAVSQWKAPAEDASGLVLVKDNIGVAGFAVTAGSFALKDVKGVDASCIKRLKEGGFLPLGKTTMSELAGFVSTTMPPGYSELGGQGVNPIDPALSPGGSSSGSAIAVAAGLCHAAVGTETNGSIVIPALACGVVGVKPTVGLISREGVVPLAHTFDTPGAIASDVREAARLLEALAGPDENDPATLRYPHGSGNSDFYTDLGGGRSRIRLALAVPQGRVFDDEQRKALSQLIAAARPQGIDIVEAPAPEIETHYKEITSTEIQGDFDRYLAKYGCQSAPKTFRELVEVYERRRERHPFGIDRLTDALLFDPDLNNAAYRDALQTGTENARGVIECLLKTHRARGVVSLGFLSWWAIAGAPYVALPLAQRSNRAMLGITVGCRRFEDRLALDIAARLEEIIAGIRD